MKIKKNADRFELLEYLPSPQRIAFIASAGKISRPDPGEIKKRNKDKQRQKRRAIVGKESRVRVATGIRRARDLVKYGIYMNAVDTGWVTDEDHAILVKYKEDRHDFQPPLDIVDGTARAVILFFMAF